MALTKNQRVQLKAKFGGRCAYCGEELGSHWHADHIEPVMRGYMPKTPDNPQGMSRVERDTPENMMPACSACNIHKSSFTLEFWREELTAQLGRLHKYQKSYRMAKKFGLVAETGAQVIFYFEKCQ
jgi:hypothetical protein